jgi:hypothetical protein
MSSSSVPQSTTSTIPSILDEEYNLIFTTVVTRVDPLTLDELYSQLLSFE